MHPFEFGQFVAGTLRQSKSAADAGLDNELSPDAIAGMQQAKALLKRTPEPPAVAKYQRTPLKRYSPTPGPTDTRVPPLPSLGKNNFEAEYDAWRMAQGLTPGHGTPATSLPSGVADAPPPVTRPAR